MIVIVSSVSRPMLPTRQMASRMTVARKLNRRWIPKATETGDTSEKVTEIVEDLKGKWDKVEEKPAAVGLTVAAVIALWTLNGVVGAVDSIPIVSNLLELIGIAVTAWFVYRYLLFKPDREEFAGAIKDFTKKVSGKQ
eukprot:TRINITY_DN3269_c0_g2_i2.p3 TRINITY_DN3269_c0_g2~~TRINITY_DN3269_c0_g2_i2.p3  ORF type:complete len:138 (+),score=30.44 TRINITY_DN3269_c0_g2_i2:68-481(+)